MAASKCAWFTPATVRKIDLRPAKWERCLKVLRFAVWFLPMSDCVAESYLRELVESAVADYDRILDLRNKRQRLQEMHFLIGPDDNQIPTLAY